MRSDSWQTSLPASSVLDRIRELTLDLQSIQNELCRELALPDGTPKSSPISSDLRSADDMVVLKAAVDQFRRVLWYYLDQTGQALDNDDEMLEPSAPRHVLMAPATPPVAKPAKADLREGKAQPHISFFDRLELVIEGYAHPGGPLAGFDKTPKSQ